MFSNKPKNDNANLPVRSAVPSIISGDLNIQGNLVCEGSIEIEGKIEGNVTCHLATIRKSGFVKGDVIADAVSVDGEIVGLVKARSVKLSETAKVTGIIMYESLSIEDGAYIDGQCKSTDKNTRQGSAELSVAHSNHEAAGDLRSLKRENELDEVAHG